jgi:DNA-binding transcriptional regulator GbsR (MarR family)
LNDNFKRVRDQIIDFNSDHQTLFSMPHTVRRLMSVMYYYEKPMTLDDMTELLGMSKASMSIAVRELDEMGLVKKIWKKGERKDIYQVEEDNYDSFIKFFCYHWRKSVVPQTNALKKFIYELKEIKENDDLDEESKELIEKDLKKLYSGLEYLDWLSRLIQSFESNEIFDFIPKISVEEIVIK